jgi:hypothetical protein
MTKWKPVQVNEQVAAHLPFRPKGWAFAVTPDECAIAAPASASWYSCRSLAERSSNCVDLDSDGFIELCPRAVSSHDWYAEATPEG